MNFIRINPLANGNLQATCNGVLNPEHANLVPHLSSLNLHHTCLVADPTEVELSVELVEDRHSSGPMRLYTDNDKAGFRVSTFYIDTVGGKSCPWAHGLTATVLVALPDLDDERAAVADRPPEVRVYFRAGDHSGDGWTLDDVDGLCGAADLYAQGSNAGERSYLPPTFPGFRATKEALNFGWIGRRGLARVRSVRKCVTMWEANEEKRRGGVDIALRIGRNEPSGSAPRVQQVLRPTPMGDAYVRWMLVEAVQDLVNCLVCPLHAEKADKQRARALERIRALDAISEHLRYAGQCAQSLLECGDESLRIRRRLDRLANGARHYSPSRYALLADRACEAARVAAVECMVAECERGGVTADMDVDEMRAETAHMKLPAHLAKLDTLLV